MTIHYEYLSERAASDLFRTFVEAFSDYAVDMSYISEENFLNRSIKNGHRRKGIATALLRHQIEKSQKGKSSVKLINVEHSDTGMLAFLKQIGFVEYVNQFEMELVLA